jgi:hypothetical protein
MRGSRVDVIPCKGIALHTFEEFASFLLLSYLQFCLGEDESEAQAREVCLRRFVDCSVVFVRQVVALGRNT